MADNLICIYCQEREADGRDHVPPKSIFPKPRPSDLISVPSCEECNGGFSQLDEEFAFWLSHYVGPSSPTTKRLYDQRAVGTGRHNRRLGQRILNEARPAELHTPGGLYVGDVVAIPWDSAPYLPVIQRTVRGLYYDYHSRPLALERDVEATLMAAPPVLDPPLPLSIHEVGGGQFRYGHCFNETDLDSSMWVLEFHGRVWAMANTLPAA